MATRPVATGLATPRRRGRQARRGLGRLNLAGLAGAGVWAVVVLLPLYYLVATALQDRSAYLDRGPLAPPQALSLENFRVVFEGGFGHYLVNTTIVTGGTVALVLALALPAAYAMVRSPHGFVSATFSVFLLGLAIPAQATIIPVYLLITRMNLYDTLVAIILPTAAFALPLSIIVLTGALRDVPRELYEAMALDGGRPRHMLRHLVVPMSRGGIVTVGIYTALQAWNGFLFPLVLTQSQEQRVLTLALWSFKGEFGVNVPGLMAAVLLSALPFFVLYLVARRWIVAGLVGSGGK